MAQNVYNWDFIHRYFPSEQIEKYRQQIINDWESGLFKNEDIWEKYGMCENTFYELIKRYSNQDDFKDKSKKPKNPYRKLEEEDVKIIIEKAQNEQERIKTCQLNFEKDMIQDGCSLSESKLEGLKEKMNNAIHGARRIANEFNMDMLGMGRIVDIGKSRVHEILAYAKIYKEKNILKNIAKRLKRPKNHFKIFRWTLPRRGSVMERSDKFLVSSICIMMHL